VSVANSHGFKKSTLGSDYPSGNGRSDMAKKKPRSASKQYCLEVHTRMCGIGGINQGVGAGNKFRSCMCIYTRLLGQRSRIHENPKSQNCHLTYHVFSLFEEL
jgi:hypothetical protein